MRNVEELAEKHLSCNYGELYPYDKKTAKECFIDGYNKAKEWIKFTDKNILQEGTYLCKWEGAKPEWTEVKLLFWAIGEDGGDWIDINGDYDENVTHYKYID